MYDVINKNFIKEKPAFLFVAVVEALLKKKAVRTEDVGIGKNGKVWKVLLVDGTTDEVLAQELNTQTFKGNRLEL